MRAGLPLDLGDHAASGPIFLAIARAIADDIVRGRLKPGQNLPGSRTLAQSLGVHRNTVLAAYRELEAEGYTAATPARATRVNEELPPRLLRTASNKPAAKRSRAAGFDLDPPVPSQAIAEPRRGAIALYGGSPDLSLVPTQALARAYRRALLSKPSPLGYGDPAGEPVLRVALSDLAARSRGVAAGPEEVVITRGSQLALYLVARVLLRPSDAVAVEAWGYRPAWEALRQTGAELIPVPVDGEGIDVETLSRISDSRTLRAVYVTPHHQFPTTSLLGQRRRMELLGLAKRKRIAIIEDDYDHEFHYDKRPVLPLASQDHSGSVIYLGTLSKILAPGLRLGFVIAPPPLVERLVAYRTLVDRQGDRVQERAIAELLEDGEVERHARRMRRIYGARRDVMVEALRKNLGGTLEYEVPAGGMAIWAHAPGVDVDGWAARAEEKGVLIQTAQRFSFDGKRRPYLRLGFAGQPEKKLESAIVRLGETLAE